jgi:hypothetical protein
MALTDEPNGRHPKDDGTALRAVAAQVEELEAEIAASQDRAALD